MAQGNYGTSDSPLEEIHGEQIVYEPLTSDPSDREEGSKWFRSDLDSGNKIGTLRLQNDDAGTDIDDIPVFDESETTVGVVKARPIQTANGEGFVPYVEEGGAFNQLRFQHNGTWYGAHDNLAVLSDKAIHRLTLDDSSPFEDSIGNEDATNNGTSQVTSSDYQGGAARDGNGTDEYIDWSTLGDFGSSSVSGSSHFAIGLTIDNWDGASGREVFLGTQDAGAARSIFIHNAGDDSGVIEFSISDDNGDFIAASTSGSYDDDSKHRILVQKTGDSSTDLEIYVDDSEDVSAGVDQGFGTFSDLSDAIYLLARNRDGNTERNANATIDDVIVYDDSLIAGEISNDYNLQPWAGGSGNESAETLSVIGSVSDTDLSQPHDTFHQGNYVYSAGKGGSVVSTDVSTDTSPTIADAITTYTEVQFVHVDVNDSTVLYAGDNGQLLTIDITDPTNISEGNSLSVSDFTQPNGQVQVGNSLYVAAKDRSYNEFNISTPSSPSLSEQRVISSSDHAPHDVAFGNSTLFGVNQAQNTTDPQVFALDPSNSFATLDSVDDISDLEGANRVQFYDEYLYVACNYADTVAVFDASNTSSLSNVGVYSTRSAGPSGMELDESGDRLFVGTTEHLQIYDITDPESLSEIAYHDFGSNVGTHDPTLPFSSGTRVAWPGQANDALYISDT